MISPILLAPGVGDPGFDPEFNKGSELVSQNLATEYKKIAVRYHADFLDAASVANASETDRQHLDALGHRLLAEAIYKRSPLNQWFLGELDCNLNDIALEISNLLSLETDLFANQV